MAKNNHKCIVCGKEYRYCPNCSEYDKMPRWMSMFCGDNCHDIFQVACDFENGDITKEEAVNKLNMLDLSSRKIYKDSLKNSIDKIFGNNINDIKEKHTEPKVESVEKHNNDNFNYVNKQFKNFNKKK